MKKNLLLPATCTELVSVFLFATAIPIRRAIGIFTAAATCLVMLIGVEASFAQSVWTQKANFGL